MPKSRTQGIDQTARTVIIKDFESESAMKKRITRWGTALIWAYLTYFILWLALYVLTGDRFPYVALFNSLGIFWFYPLPALALAAFLVKRREIWAGTGLVALAFLWLWGPTVTPPTGKEPTGPHLKVLTYNVQGQSEVSYLVLETIRQEDADVVFLQELSYELAGRLSAEFKEEYPYQVLHPKLTVNGAGILSKYPLHYDGDTLGGRWKGDPIVASLDWNGREITLVCFHMLKSVFGEAEFLGDTYRAREEAARKIAVLADNSEPLLAAGDANMTQLNTGYDILAASLSDSWVEAGWGLGNSFPARNLPGSVVTWKSGWPVFGELIRIDYVFHSEQWQAVSARLAANNGGSDHRGVVVELVWVGDGVK